MASSVEEALVTIKVVTFVQLGKRMTFGLAQ